MSRVMRSMAVVSGCLLLGAGVLGSESPVADAAQQGDLEAVRALVRDGADVNASQGDGMTALHWSAENGDAAMARVLLFAGAHADPSTRLGGYTPLHLGSRAGHVEVVAALLEGGSDVATLTHTGVSALHLAAESGSADLVRVLVEHGADVNVRDGHADRTPLMFAVGESRVSAMQALMDLGADITLESRVVDYAERSSLDREERVMRARRMAMAKGEDPEGATMGPYGTPVGQAGDPTAAAAQKQEKAAEQHAEAVDKSEDALERAAAQADPDGPSPVAGTAAAGPQPLSYAELVGRQGGMSALHYAARDGRAVEARMLLDAGADVDVPTGGDRSTPLLISVINGNFDLALDFLERGANPNLISEDGVGPLFAAVNSRWNHRTWYPQPNAWRQQDASHLDLMKALLEAGADPNHRVGTHPWYVVYNAGRIGVDYAGATPFWRAAYSHDVDAMKLLVAHGADPSIPTVKPASRSRGSDDEEDPSGLPPVPAGGPAVYPIHAASGVGYGTSRVGQQHVHVPDGWLPAVRYLVELGADVNVRDHDGYSAVHNAAARGDNELILYLVEQGADVTFVSRRGQTTVDMANGPQQRVQPFPETIALLESLGARNNHKCLSC